MYIFKDCAVFNAEKCVLLIERKKSGFVGSYLGNDHLFGGGIVIWLNSRSTSGTIGAIQLEKSA